MASSPIITLRVEPELAVALRAQARDAKVQLSEYVRALLRQAAGVCDPFTSGYREGKNLGYAEARQSLETRFNGIPDAPRGSGND